MVLKEQSTFSLLSKTVFNFVMAYLLWVYPSEAIRAIIAISLVYRGILWIVLGYVQANQK